MYCLARTAKTEKKQAGISFILLNLKQSNIDIKPIKLLSGQSPFCQVFFDDVVAKESHRIAKENEGWKVAKRLLEFERTMMAREIFGKNSFFWSSVPNSKITGPNIEIPKLI